MSNLSVTLFDQLAIETILDIWQYLSPNDIIYAFFNINQRFNSILFRYQRTFNNTDMVNRDFSFWQDTLMIMGCEIEHLIISTNDNWFSLNLFPNLKSIVLSSSIGIHFDQIKSLLENEQFRQLSSFEIKCLIFNETNDYVDMQRILLNQVFDNDNHLQIFQYSSQFLISLQLIINLKINDNLCSLSLKFISLIDILHLLPYVPNLQRLSLIVTSFYEPAKLHEEFQVSHIKLEKFSLTYQKNAMTNESSFINKGDLYFLFYVIKLFSSSLISLSLNLHEKPIEETNQFQFNGIFLQEQFLQTMIRLKVFGFYVRLYEEPKDIQYVLSTFENSFWFDHHWCIAIDRKSIYTLPFDFHHLDEFIGFDHVKMSSSMFFSNSSKQYYRTKSIHVIKPCDFNLNLIKQMKINMPNLTSIRLASTDLQQTSIFQECQTNHNDIKVSTIKTVHCGYECLVDLTQWLIYIFPNVTRLVLTCEHTSWINYSLNQLYLELIGSYSRHVRTANDDISCSGIKDIEVKSFLGDEEYLGDCFVEPMKNLLELFPNCQTILFHFYYTRSSNKPYTSMNKIISLLDDEQYLKDYHIKHSYNCVQLIRHNENIN